MGVTKQLVYIVERIIFIILSVVFTREKQYSSDLTSMIFSYRDKMVQLIGRYIDNRYEDVLEVSNVELLGKMEVDIRIIWNKDLNRSVSLYTILKFYEDIFSYQNHWTITFKICVQIKCDWFGVEEKYSTYV